jgi:hypothetical protein
MSNSPTDEKKIIDGMTYGFSIGDMLYYAMKIPME